MKKYGNYASIVRSVPSVCLPRRLEMTSPRQLVTGKVWRSPSSWRSKTDRPRLQSFPLLRLSSSRPWRNPQGTGRKWRTSSTTVTSPWMISSMLPEWWGLAPCPVSSPAAWRRFLELPSLSVAPLTAWTHTMSLMVLMTDLLSVHPNKLSIVLINFVQ